MNNIENKIYEVYNFLKIYISKYNYPPSVREICKELNIKSTASVYVYLERLQSKGLLIKSPDKKRAYTLIDKEKDTYKDIVQTSPVPVIGTVTAGIPIFATENFEEYSYLPSEFNNKDKDLFILNVKGNSMIEAGILNGDKIIVKRQNQAENGQKVVALIDDSATVKTFYKKKNKIVLHPENQDMQDMIFDNVEILGIVLGLYRKY